MQPEVSIKEERGVGVPVLVAAGSNLGDRAENLAGALRAIDMADGCRVSRVAGLYETAPVNAAGGDFLNTAALVTTLLAPQDLLRLFKSIEGAFGRTGASSDARPIDLDILFFGSRVIDDTVLTIPHPRWIDRLFVTIPLADICGGMTDPTSGRRIADIIAEVIAGTVLPSKGVRLVAAAGWFGQYRSAIE